MDIFVIYKIKKKLIAQQNCCGDQDVTYLSVTEGCDGGIMPQQALPRSGVHARRH